MMFLGPGPDLLRRRLVTGNVRRAQYREQGIDIDVPFETADEGQVTFQAVSVSAPFSIS
jgi:hypothetical protein